MSAHKIKIKPPKINKHPSPNIPKPLPIKKPTPGFEFLGGAL